ncbi:MAG: glycosyltransferase, partial [Clostridia bacterium]|nr:glycosyltransferase [Clostridia bacterium]
MLRVLHSVSNMARAGIETMLMNYYREMDRSRIQFDFLANKPAPGEYDAEISSMGGRVFVSPGLNPLHFPRYRRYVAELLRSNPDIRIVHAHNEAMGYYALQSAKDAGLQV